MMCKAKNYAEQLLNIYDIINNDFRNISKELSQVDLKEQDILHIIEKGGFNAAQGYKLCKQIFDNRQERRKIKNELSPLVILNDNFIKRNKDLLNRTYKSITNQDDLLTKLTENKIYTPRVIKDENQLEKPDLKIVSNTNFNFMRCKRNNKKIISWMQTDDQTIYAKYSDGVKNLIKIKDVVDFDESKKVMTL